MGWRNNFQDNTNYVRRKILLLMRREKARKVLRRVVRWCVKQAEEGRYFLLENPATSRLWLEPLVVINDRALQTWFSG